MSGRDLFKFGIVVIGGGALLGLACAAIAGAFSPTTAIVCTVTAGIAMAVGWVIGVVAGATEADRTACRRAQADKAMGEDCLIGLAMAANELTDVIAEASYERNQHPKINEGSPRVGLLEIRTAE